MFFLICLLLWSPRPGLNWWPHPYQGCALPTELRGHNYKLFNSCSKNINLERETGFEPATLSLEGWRSSPWATPAYPSIKNWWRGEDSNLRRLRRQIYSLLPLAAREPLQLYDSSGAGDGTRTRNLLITNQLLYRLSYASKPILLQSFRRQPFLLWTQKNDYTASCELRTLIFMLVFVK